MRALGLHAMRVCLTVVLGILASATLVRFSPGSGTDQRQLDLRLSESSLAELRKERAAGNSLPAFYLKYAAGLLRGDLGYSTTFARPVRDLFAERVPETLRLVALGLLGGWLVALSAAGLVCLARSRLLENLGTVLAGFLLAIPAAVLALVFLFAGGAAPAALAAILTPRIYRQAFDLLKAAYALPHVLSARARGVGPLRLLARHALPAAGPALSALAGVSVAICFGAAIPVEVICDAPGIGQLAWQAALARDLPVLVNLTLLLTLVTVLAGTLSQTTAPEPLRGCP
jgi:peptide/nickel transport system permease protein